MSLKWDRASDRAIRADLSAEPWVSGLVCVWGGTVWFHFQVKGDLGEDLLGAGRG